jgi:hypothetical protein
VDALSYCPKEQTLPLPGAGAEPPLYQKIWGQKAELSWV